VSKSQPPLPPRLEAADAQRDVWYFVPDVNVPHETQRRAKLTRHKLKAWDDSADAEHHAACRLARTIALQPANTLFWRQDR
jgi:hypothetical protein